MSARFEIPEWLGEQSAPPLPPVDDHRIEDLVNRFIAGKQEALFIAPDAFYRRAGGDAVDAAPAIADRLQALRDATLEQARDDGERAVLGPRLDLHVEDALDGIGRHVAAQRTVHQRQVVAERQALIRRAAELEPDNDDKIAGLADAHASAARERVRLDGVAPDSPEAAAAEADARSQILRAAIDRRIATAMPDKAVTLYDRAKATLSPADRRALALPIGNAIDDAATDAWLAREAGTDGAPLVDRAGLDGTLSDRQRLILRAKIGARESAEESRRFATVKGLDDQLATATATLATQPSLYRPGTLARLAEAYADASAPGQADATRRLALLESYFRTFAQAGAAAQQRHLADFSGPERAMAEAIVRHQDEAFARDPYAAGTALYPEVGPPLPEEDAEGRLRQARMIEAMREAPASSDATAAMADEQAGTPRLHRADLPERDRIWTDGASIPQRVDPNVVSAADKPEDAPLPSDAGQKADTELAQAKQPPAKAPSQRAAPNPAQKTNPSRQSKPSQQPTKPPSAEEIALEAERRAMKWVDFIYGQPDTSDQQVLPENWQQTTNPQYVEWMRDAARKNGVPLELLARHLYKESMFNPKAQNGSHKGMGQLGPDAVADVGIKGKFDYFDAKSSIHASAAYLALMHRRLKSWPAAIAAYNAGPGNVEAWLGYKATRYEPNKETREAIRHVFRGDPDAFK